MGCSLVSVLTPVYNGEPYLGECIESVLAQNYKNWEYHIVNNCSTDRTLEIAEQYARKDARIKVITNEQFVGVCENHNIAFRSINPQAKYTKFVCADDWIMPDCLSKMVHFAEAHPTVGIIGSYQRSGGHVRWQELPRTVTVLSGRDVCRLALLKGVQVFGAPTAFLYRSDIAKLTKSFLPHSRPHADTSACYEYLQYCDFGIVHEVLSVERLHDGQISSSVNRLGGGDLAYLEGLLDYGPRYLSESELSIRKGEAFQEYYRFIGGSVLKLRDRSFWNFQVARLREIGYPINWRMVGRAVIQEVMDESKRPVTACQKAIQIILNKCGLA